MDLAAPFTVKAAMLRRLAATQLSAASLRVALVLLDYANPVTGQCNPGRARIMADLAVQGAPIDGATIRKAIRALETAGLLCCDVTGTGHGRTVAYHWQWDIGLNKRGADIAKATSNAGEAISPPPDQITSPQPSHPQSVIPAPPRRDGLSDPGSSACQIDKGRVIRKRNDDDRAHDALRSLIYPEGNAFSLAEFVKACPPYTGISTTHVGRVRDGKSVPDAIRHAVLQTAVRLAEQLNI